MIGLTERFVSCVEAECRHGLVRLGNGFITKVSLFEAKLLARHGEEQTIFGYYAHKSQPQIRLLFCGIAIRQCKTYSCQDIL